MPLRLRPVAAVVVLVLAAGGAAAQQATTRWTTPDPAEIEKVYPDARALYIELHRNPELAFQETQTVARLAAWLKPLGFDVTTGVGRTGLVGVLRNGAGPTADPIT